MYDYDGTLMIWRGGVDRTVASDFSASAKYALIVRLEATPDEVVGKLYTLTIDITFEGERIGSTMRCR